MLTPLRIRQTTNTQHKSPISAPPKSSLNTIPTHIAAHLIMAARSTTTPPSDCRIVARAARDAAFAGKSAPIDASAADLSAGIFETAAHWKALHAHAAQHLAAEIADLATKTARGYSGMTAFWAKRRAIAAAEFGAGKVVEKVEKAAVQAKWAQVGEFWEGRWLAASQGLIGSLEFQLACAVRIPEDDGLGWEVEGEEKELVEGESEQEEEECGSEDSEETVKGVEGLCVEG
ncbi:hypothetical protein LTR53_009414 [Teratosphaeriaceae sp. CCFEE 6253]|nr:hypothetical protein LTR53_009414 [Teratosphaeriaceae sp. CCFEE 6253]